MHIRRIKIFAGVNWSPTVAHKGQIDFFRCNLITCDRKLLSCELAELICLVTWYMGMCTVHAC